jgi:cell division protein FtsW (lipid II flippase)
MEQIFEQLLASFNLALLFSLTIITYITLKIVDKYIDKNHNIIKHIITAVIGLILCFVYHQYLNLTLKEIIPTYLLSTAFYDVILKQILTKLNINYKK